MSILWLKTYPTYCSFQGCVLDAFSSSPLLLHLDEPPTMAALENVMHGSLLEEQVTSESLEKDPI